MKGNTINEFIDSLFVNCDKEISFCNRKMMVQGWLNSKDSTYTLQVFECTENNPVLFTKTSSERSDCVTAFEKAKIFDGKTIYEAESDIEVLYD